MLADFEELLGWPPDAWRRMGWREFWARRRHLIQRMRLRKAEQDRAAKQSQRPG